MSELDDFFNNLWKENEPEPAKEEPVKLTEEELVKETDEFYADKVVIPEKEEFGGIDFGAMFDEMVAEQKEAEKEIEATIAKELTALDKAKQEAVEAELLEEQLREERAALREEFKKAQMLVETLRKQFDNKNTEYNMAAQKKHDAERRISEEEHRLEEERREKEINDKRLGVVAGFKRHIDELNPVWKTQAFDHQWEGASTLALHGSGLLGDDMGLGKTMTIIMTLDMVQAHRTLIVTPSDVCENFTLECMMWSPHRFTMTLGNSDPTERKALMNMIFKKRLERGQEFILTINREQLYNAEFVEQLKELKFDTMIVDEFHEAKNLKGSYFDALEYIRYGNHKDETETSVEHFFPLTGTFILNEPQDIFPALYLVDKYAFPEKRDFLKFYCEQDYYTGKWKFRSGGVTSLMKNLGGRMVVRTMEEAGIKLPTQHIHDESPRHLAACVECREEFPLTFASDAYLDQRKVMKQLAEHSQIILDNNRKTSVIEQIALITRQRQAIVWPGGITLTGEYEDGTPFQFSVGDDVQESIKIDWVEWKIRQKLGQGKRVVVFSQFATGLSELEKRLSDSGVRAVRYDGSTSQTIKSEVKRDFDRRHVIKNNGEYKWDVVLANFKTGGVGLNFTHATEMVMLDEEWNPGKNEQAYRRTKRMGQTEETHVWIPRVHKSIDTWMKELNDRKRNMIDGFNLEVDMSKDFHNFLDTVKGI
ncbi:helicase [Arthrobacter phage Jasmine]|uniref:DNA helicase n=1 Tax=Arthrobacter phage Jasmine TaxID=1772302 RepID=A0A0U4IV97_9CAUD|nr:helicase [Arthrobacter phage Jasmine]ALY09319.1 DNA helicase [Arthrobacter phage Jasmine]